MSRAHWVDHGEAAARCAAALDALDQLLHVLPSQSERAADAMRCCQAANLIRDVRRSLDGRWSEDNPGKPPKASPYYSGAVR
ncbi:MAG: hypothetical protein KC503_36795 [Myxococcales bacterium]|nr:hypothetical protein [Myxococcales bacterium]